MLEVTTEPLLRRLVGEVLRRRRREQGRILKDVADEARVSLAYLSEIERGRKEASSEVLQAVCRALDLRLVDLVGAAHAELAAAEGRVVLDLTAPDALSGRRTARAVPAPSRAVGGPADVVLLAA